MNDFGELSEEQAEFLVDRTHIPSMFSLMLDTGLPNSLLMIMIMDTPELHEIIKRTSDQLVDHEAGWVLIKNSGKFDINEVWLRLEVDYVFSDKVLSLITVLNVVQHQSVIEILAQGATVGLSPTEEAAKQFEILTVSNTPTEPLDLALELLKLYG